MNIRTYMRKYKLMPAEFAAGAGISVAALYRYMKPGAKMNRNTALRIEKFTAGEVKEEELRPYE